MSEERMPRAVEPEGIELELEPIPGLEPRHRVFHVFREIYLRALRRGDAAEPRPATHRAC